MNNRMILIRFLMLFLMLSCISLSSFAQKDNASQKNWKKLVKEAEEFEKLGDLGRAAIYYESAFAQNDKPELMYLAGRCYLETRDYANAAKCLDYVKNENANTAYDKPGFKYSLALKQVGQYEQAKEAFNNFINKYNAADKESMRAIVETEIQGCNFALKAQEYTNPSISIAHLDPNINTDKTEFAPIPFNDDVLYFSSTISGVSKVYRSQKRPGSTWMTRQVPTIFTGKMEKPHFGNGSFTPDGKRFYFTQCDLGEGGKPKCAIYVMMEEEGGEWSKPVLLPDYVNAAGANTTHPFVTVEDDKEVLYFASNREGGKGGLDLWYCSRTLDSKGNNFTLPKNLGHNINTQGDELTPYYHTATQTLYFSSNGRISAGGLDVFKSKGSQMKWEVAQNLGFPINSSADDLYFVVSEAHGGGYLVSNRTFDPEKVATTNDDIFYFGEQKVQMVVKGSIYAKEDPNRMLLRDVNIKLFQVLDGSEEMIEDRMLSVGEYKFVLDANKKYLIEVKTKEFGVYTKEYNTAGLSKIEVVNADIALALPEPKINPMFVVVPEKYNSKTNAYRLPDQVPNNPKTNKPYAKGTEVYEAYLEADDIAKESPERKVYWAEDGNLKAFIPEVVASKEPEPIKTNPPPKEAEKPTIFEHYKDKTTAPEKISYKIQVSAVRNYKEYKYKDLQLGPLADYKLDFEPIDGGVTRILIVPKTKNEDGTEGFKSKADALNVLSYILDHTRFSTAFVNRYESGERAGDGFRGWDE